MTERFPDDAILSEEGQNDDRRLTVSRCWIVDPIDGTEQFIQRTGEFDVLVALVEGGRPSGSGRLSTEHPALDDRVKHGGAWMRCGESAWRRVRLEPAVPSCASGRRSGLAAPGNAAIIDSVASQLASLRNNRR